MKAKELKMLSPFTDEEETIRVGGRIDNALVSYEARHPALLPYGHRIARFVIEGVSPKGHTGVATTVAKTRRMYWISSSTRFSQNYQSNCVTCRAANPKTETQIMANFPQQRLQPHSLHSTTRRVTTLDH